MNVIIVAGGLGTRFEDLSFFPKVLLPTKKYNSLLDQNYDLLIRSTDSNFYLIINEKYYNMTVNYCHVNNIDVNIISSSNTNGSYNTILSVYEQIPHNDILFVWSDLELNNLSNIHDIHETTIFTYDDKYRYGIKDGKISLHSNYDGNIPGIYFIKNLDKYFSKYKLDEKTNYDLIDVLKDTDNHINHILFDGIIQEYKDKQTYIDHIKSKDKVFEFNFKTRFFNMIEPDYSIPNNYKIRKWTNNEDYYHLIKKEYEWYQNLKNLELENYSYNKIVPTIYGQIKDGYGFEMELLENYKPLHKYIKDCILKNMEEDVYEIYNTIYNHLNALSKCEKYVDKNIFESDLKKEIITKVIDRCNKIKYMLKNYSESELQELLNKAYNYLYKSAEEFNNKIKYCVCHGDLNGSNILVNPQTKDVKFLDPRGYFGNTIFYGWQDYEFAKLLYCLDGYDDFNNLPQIYGLDKPIRLKFFNKIDYINKKKYRVLVGVIWIALAGYISQDIMKANIAYDYGFEMLNKELEDE